MEDPRIAILGNSSIGIFGFSTDTYTILPNSIKQQITDTVQNVLDTPLVCTSISDTSLNGLFVTGNTNHLLLPYVVTTNEYNNIHRDLIVDDLTIHVLESKITALGNAIVTNDKVALVHRDFTREDKLQISDMLDVDVESTSFMDSSVLGSMIFLSKKGFLTHPLLSEEEIELLSSFFGLSGDVVTVNRGLPYPRLGIIANSNGILVGSDTTGPEILRITEVLS